MNTRTEFTPPAATPWACRRDHPDTPTNDEEDPVNTTTVIGLLALGAAGGFPLGRWWADAARARHDIARTWHSRTHYRRRNR